MDEQVIVVDEALSGALAAAGETATAGDVAAKLDELSRLEAEVGRRQLVRKRAEDAARRARRAHRDAVRARDACAREIAVTARLAGVELVSAADASAGQTPEPASADEDLAL